MWKVLLQDFPCSKFGPNLYQNVYLSSKARTCGFNLFEAVLFIVSPLGIYDEDFCLFDLILYDPVNNFSVMSGQVFLG